MSALTANDLDLIERAERLIAERGDDELHTVAAATRSTDGRVVAGVNVYHFTGGPCAEIVTLGIAVSEGLGTLDTMVAVGDRGRSVMSPCGRCRQMLFDLQPDLQVIVPGPDGPEKRSLPELLPGAFAWTPQGGSLPPAA